MSYDTVQNNGTPLPQRTTLNVAPPISASDNGGASRTDVALAIDAVNDAGAVAKQLNTPGIQQTGHLSLSGSGLFGSAVGIGTPTPVASALLDVTSLSKGFAPPRMTITQIANIASPIAGLLAYDISTKTLKAYDGTRYPSLGRTTLRVEDNGAVADGAASDAASITAGTNILTTPTASFSQADVSKSIVVTRAGAAGVPLSTTITVVDSATQVRLAANASNTVVQARAVWGTDNKNAIQTTIAEASSIPSATVELSYGTYFLNGEITIPGAITIRGQGINGTRIFQGGQANTFTFTVSASAQQIRAMTICGLGTGDTLGAAAVKWTAAPQFQCGLYAVSIRDFGFGVYNNTNTVGVGGGTIILQDVNIFEVGYATPNGGVGVLTTGSLIWTRGLIFTQRTRLTGLSINAAEMTLMAATSQFTSQDIGKRIVVNGAGFAGDDLVANITAVATATACTISVAAGTSVSAADGSKAPDMNAGIQMYGTDLSAAAYINALDIVGGVNSLIIGPTGSSLVRYCFFNNLLCDSASDVGLLVAPTSGGQVASMHWINSWFASAGAEPGGGQNRQSIRIVGSTASIKSLNFVGCRVVLTNREGIFISGGKNISIRDSEVDTSHAIANAYDAVTIDGVSDLSFQNNVVGHAYFGAGGPTDRYSLNLGPGVSGNVNVTGNRFADFGTASIDDLIGALPTKRFQDNWGYNPRGANVATPTVPASGAPQANTTGVDCAVYLAGGTLTGVAVGGGSTGIAATNTNYQVPAGSTITLIYTGPPTWKWIGS